MARERSCRVCSTKISEDSMVPLEKEEGIVINICPDCFSLILHLYRANIISTIENLRNWLVKPSKRGEKKEDTPSNREKLDEYWKEKTVEDL